MASPSAQLAAEAFKAGSADETRSQTTQNTSSSGVKRKRGTELKFYAVRTGHAPGIYHSWADCKAQITGYKKATCETSTCTLPTKLNGCKSSHLPPSPTQKPS